MYSDVNLLGLLFFVSEIKKTVGAKGGRVPHLPGAQFLADQLTLSPVVADYAHHITMCPPPPDRQPFLRPWSILPNYWRQPVSLSEKITNRNYFYVYSK